MKFLKSVSRLLTIPVLGRERRKRARLEVEEALNALFRTEKYIYTRRFEQAAALNLSLPRQNFHVISLGTNCFPRMTLNLWGLKPRKAEGEPSMPFDLSVHPLPVVVKYLKNHFEGYFDAVEFDEKNGYWVNPSDGIKFIHDKQNDRDFFVDRYRKRIANLWAALDDDKPCLLVCHDMGGVDTAKVNELYDFIQTRCGRKKFKLILAVFNGTVGKCNENIKVYTDNFPCKNYLYMDKFAKFTKAGYHFEEPFRRFCREEVLEMLEN